MAAFNRGTKVYAKIETLGAQGDTPELTVLAAVSQCDADKLFELRRRSEALRPASARVLNKRTPLRSRYDSECLKARP